MKRIWVTGAAGLLGHVLVPRLAARGWQPSALSLTGRNGTTPLDLSDFSRTAVLFEKERPAVVLHSAALSDVDGCERDPALAHAANALSTKNLARLCSGAGVPLVYVSTDYVFDGSRRTPYRESDPTFPVNIYGLTKLEGEWHAASCAAGGAIVRTSWLFGGPNPTNFVNAVLERLKREKEVSVLDDQTDCPTLAADLAGVLEAIAAKLAGGPRGQVRIYHACNDGGTTRLEMTRFIQKTLQLPVVVKVADRSSIRNRVAVRPEHSVMSCGRLLEDFGIRMRPWEDALREYLQNPSACAS
jgi:dTDP-4-dehydrorhamnose reductase